MNNKYLDYFCAEVGKNNNRTCYKAEKLGILQ